MLNLLRNSAARRRFVQGLHDQLIARARAPVFFRALAVPDSFDGRFDLLVLHAWLALERLGAAGMGNVAQGLTDAIFSGFDEALREQGVSDMGMGRRMKALADAFYGRLRVYSASSGVEELSFAFARNIYRGGSGPAERLAAYALCARRALASGRVEQGELDFGPLPEDGP